ncbi:outer membrane protein assembly factor BamC [Oceanisphaera litoralis]|uniref:outer membrane protein assembly factor BamC n=1 Tax=Oceanisphaera litoralis TaxID=225144 RepID=UPI001EF8396D|nr:outer membrane protein assembly factor BamC [Oceanisphaera litoralis]MBM7454311.1 outer membrane protein assembly factor BamC [Oceanisphaera litoralis]
MNSKTMIMGLLAMSVLAGCSNPETRAQANRGFDYEDARLRTTPLLIPAGLEAPDFNREYVIPAPTDGAIGGVTGKAVDVRPPTQVLPLVRGTEVMDGGSGLWFYQQRLEQPLEQELSQALDAFFKGQKAEFSRTAQGWRSDGRAIGSEQQHFSWQLVPDEVRRAVAVQIRIEGGDTQRAQDRQRAEAAMLNAFSLSYQRELTKQQNLLDRSPITLTLDQVEGRLLTDEGYDRSWKRLVALLPQLGFELTNRQQALGYVDVEFDGLSKGKWRDLGLPALNIPEQEYRIQLGDLGEQSSITLSDKNKVPVSADILSQLARTLNDAFQRTDLIR